MKTKVRPEELPSISGSQLPMLSGRMLLSIAIVSWNTRDLLRDCLSSVFENLDNLKAEVVVVDNGSTDGSAEMVRNEFPQVNLVEAGENLGFTRANNLAYKLSNGKYFLLLNSDTVVLPDALSRMLRFMEAYPVAGAVGCRLLNGDGTLQRSCSCFPTVTTELFDALYLSKLFPKSQIFGKGAMSYWDFSSIREVEFAGGSCLMLRRTALEVVGLLDEKFFMYSEEIDLCYRLKCNDWKVFFIPDARVIHYGGQSSKLDVNRTSVELCRSKYKFMRKHYGLASATAYRTVVLLSSGARLMVWGAKSIFGSNKHIYRQKVSVQGRLLSWAVITR
jgi:GT2 family glycosyltransferase